MSTYGTLQDRIADELARTDLTTQIQYAVKDAVKHYQGTKFWFNQVYRTTATLSTSAATLALSAFAYPPLQIDMLRIADSSHEYVALSAPYADVASQLDAVNDTVARPAQYAIYGETILFNAFAQSNYAVVIDGLRKYDELSATADTNVWTTDAERLIRAAAKREIYQHVIMDNDRAQAMAAIEKHEFDALKAKGAIRASGRIKPTQF